MPTRPTWPARLLLLACVVAALVGLPKISEAKGKAPAPQGPQPWCAPEIETLPGDVCFLDGGAKASARRTLVIFLHGAIAKNSTWSWNHERAIIRLAQYHGVDIAFPRSPLTESGYIWPGKLDQQEAGEQALIDNWTAAKTFLEKRNGHAFEEVYLMGFSSGAYFISSLAMRGRVDVDGYATMCGGQSMPARSNPVDHFAPVLVGVCAKDATTKEHAIAFAGALASAGIPRAVSIQNVGHGVSDYHFANALSYLRSQTKPRVASRLVDFSWWRFAIEA